MGGEAEIREKGETAPLKREKVLFLKAERRKLDPCQQLPGDTANRTWAS